MKREIKFRVWDKVKHRMIGIEQLAFDIDGELVSIYSNGPDFSNDVEALMGEKPDLNDAVLMEYTGLKDKNGKPIYEGDIVHGYDQEPDRDDGYIGSSVTDVVNFENGAFWIGNSWYKVMVITPPIVEVIGNIHANPELLEEEK